uniref:TYR_PHOSPHATASE_2 domain-containing protein n=1 Tax=Globodera pallida TaxID=36090 RepID=A0A183CDW8_GLOPA
MVRTSRKIPTDWTKYEPIGATIDLLIGVNCSNGVNRSGYLICNYLISRLGWSSHDALNAFENARGYPIERGSYVQALHKADREHRCRWNWTKMMMADEFNSQLTAQMMQQFFNIEQKRRQRTRPPILRLLFTVQLELMPPIQHKKSSKILLTKTQKLVTQNAFLMMNSTTVYRFRVHGTH